MSIYKPTSLSIILPDYLSVYLSREVGDRVWYDVAFVFALKPFQSQPT